MAPPTVLVVDDEPLNLAVLSQLLSPPYRVLGARSGAAALALLEGGARPDLILLDVMMPEMDGHTVLQRLRALPAQREVPVMFVTALGAEVDEERGLALGAVDYIVKPIKPAVVLSRVHSQIELKRARDRLADQNAWLEAELARRIHENLLAQDLTLCAMAELAETRDSDTGNHVQRTQTYVECLARRLQADPAHADALGEAQLQRIVKAAPMHDIGKIGIPDQVLLKPARLTREEFEVMKGHARIGGETIARAVAKATARHPGEPGVPTEALRFLEVARTIATHHHERWDGAGYPDGLAGEAIPLAARLMAVADVFDSLVSPRVYKKGYTVEQARADIVAGRGTQFDPDVVDAFCAGFDDFVEVARRHGLAGGDNGA
jgi:putative two-component system response regulator